MKMKKIVVGLTAGVLVSLSVATTAFAAGSPSTDKVVTPTPTPKASVTPTPKPAAPAKETAKAPAKKAAKKKGKSDKTGETVPVFPAAAAACLAGAALFGTKIKFEEE